MNKKHTNVMTLPKWMLGLKAVAPSGTYTPDQVAEAIELNMLLNGSDESLRNCIVQLINKVPLKNQPTLGAFIAESDEHMRACVKAYLEVVQQKLDALPKEITDGKVESTSTGRESPVRSTDSDWGDDWDRPSRSRPSTRGNRAVRAAKRKQADFGG